MGLEIESAIRKLLQRGRRKVKRMLVKEAEAGVAKTPIGIGRVVTRLRPPWVVAQLGPG